jgi:ATP-dependent DNA ligase
MEKTEDQLLPSLKLAVQPPIEPMLAQLTRDMPSGPGWLYEQKWDGFRSLVFWDGDTLVIQSGFDQLTFAVPIELEEIFGITQHEGSQV